MARLAIKLSQRAARPAEVEGFLPRGVRAMYAREGSRIPPCAGYARAKLLGQSFTTEVPILVPERVSPACPIADLSQATIALVTTGGLVRKGNPDKQVSANATRYFRHDVSELESLSGKDWEAYHAGYFNHIVNKNPNYILPLSFMHLQHEARSAASIPIFTVLPG
jgi:glycine reductase